MMNIRPEKKADPNLVEVIYACMDGIIYFIDLKDGKPTRPPIKTGGGPIKGTASLYPDGTPMLFVGPADDPPGMDVVRGAYLQPDRPEGDLFVRRKGPGFIQGIPEL